MTSKKFTFIAADHVHAFFEFAAASYNEGYRQVGIGDYLLEINVNASRVGDKAMLDFAHHIEDIGSRTCDGQTILLARDGAKWTSAIELLDITSIKVSRKTFDAYLLVILERMSWSIDRVKSSTKKPHRWFDLREDFKSVGVTFTDKAWSRMLDIIANVPKSSKTTPDVTRGLRTLSIDKDGIIHIK